MLHAYLRVNTKRVLVPWPVSGGEAPCVFLEHRPAELLTYTRALPARGLYASVL